MASTAIPSPPPVLPPLTERIARDSEGAREFERLMHQLLLVHAGVGRFHYAQADGHGVDGLARHGIPGLDGIVAFHFQWLWDNIHEGDNEVQIWDPLELASRPDRGIQHWILVTPWDLAPSEVAWLQNLRRRRIISVLHWGQAKIEELLRQCPPLFARYFPQAARPLVDGFDGTDFRELAQKYREQVEIAHRGLKTIGLPPETVRARDSRADLRLDALFIPLRLLPEQADAEPEELANVLATDRSIVVLGDPGMGKSTLLAYISLLFANGASLDGFSPRSATVPFFISLRDLVRLQKDNIELSFVEYLETHARQRFQMSQVHRVFFDATLRMGEAVVLLDGLDEVGSESARHRVATAIRAFQAQYPACRLWITARIYGYTSSVRISGEKFTHYRINRLDDEQIDSFIARWYEIQIPNDPVEREARTKALCEAIRRTPGVRRLAYNPLLLTLMAFIHHGLRKLPRDRGELYEKCIEMLLKTWQEARRDDTAAVHAIQDLKLHVATQKDYLAHLALVVQEKNHGGKDEEARGLFSRNDALDCLCSRHWQRAVRDRSSMTRGEAREEMERFLEYIGDETGLIIDRGGDQLSFIHLSFQEYLAAWAFICDKDTLSGPAFFEQHLGEPAWEEVLLLRLYIILRGPGGGGIDDFDAIVARMLRRLEKERTAQGWLTLVRALRDDLDFTNENRKLILARALGFWLDAPAFHGTWFVALEEVNIFAEQARHALRSVLAEVWAREPAARALACLHLEKQLFGFPVHAAALLRTRADLLEMLPDLVAFLGEPGIDALLADKASIAHWTSALPAFDGPWIYWTTLRWAQKSPSEAAVDAALGLLWGKILTELRSRAKFAESHRGSDDAVLFGRAGSVIAETPFSIVKLPLSGVRAPSASLPREESRPGTQMLCDRLMYERPEEEDSWAELTVWADAFISSQVESFPATETLDPGSVSGLMASFASNFGRIRAFVSGFAAGWAFSSGHAAVPDLGHEFIRSFSYHFIHSFGRRFRRNFIHQFGRALSSDVVCALGDKFGVDFNQSGWRSTWDREMEDDESGNDPIERNDFWWFAAYDRGSFRINPQEVIGQLESHLKTPLAIPFVLVDVWNVTAIGYLFTMFRHIAALNADADKLHQVTEVWIRKNPLDVYWIALAWEEHSKTFAASRNSLAAANGALFLAHAAYAGLMTGLECNEPTWQSLVETRNLDDARMRISWALYELCQFRDQAKAVGDLEREIRAPSADVRPILEAAGLALEPQETIKVITQPTPSVPPVQIIEKAPFFSWLHLSDVHFGHKSTTHQWDQSLVLDVLRKDIAEHITRGIPSPNAMLVTGDIAFSGATEQYASAKTWLLDLATRSDISPDRIFLVPGNHDVTREVDKANRNVARLLRALRDGADDLDETLANPEDRALLVTRMAPYLSFASSFPNLQSPDPLFWSHLISTPSGLPIRLIGLNTALLAADDLDKGKLRLGKQALARTLTNLPENEITFILSHHPFRDNWLADQREADSWIKGPGRIHLSGHVHEADSEESRAGSGTSLIRITAGAVHGDKLPAGVPASHGYSFAAIVPGENNTLRLRVWPRRWSEKNKHFTVDTDNTPKDRPYAEHTLPGITFKP